ncbi:Tctr2 protein [Podospora conica]|nr:Tctr2 protein [Schizothecium conicum]
MDAFRQAIMPTHPVILDPLDAVNVNTTGTCFVTSSWCIDTPRALAGACVGVVSLMMLLELLRRAAIDLDRAIVANAKDNAGLRVAGLALEYRPSFWEQLMRAVVHVCVVVVAYTLMLIAMSFNGYMIICMWIGAFLGFLVFRWETLRG